MALGAILFKNPLALLGSAPLTLGQSHAPQQTQAKQNNQKFQKVAPYASCGQQYIDET
jgi:hypothetical protein